MDPQLDRGKQRHPAGEVISPYPDSVSLRDNGVRHKERLFLAFKQNYWLLASRGTGGTVYNEGTATIAVRPYEAVVDFRYRCNLACSLCHQQPERICAYPELSPERLLSFIDELAEVEKSYLKV